VTRVCLCRSCCRHSEMLIKAIHSCGVKFPEIAHSVVLLLMDFLGSDGAPGVINFVRWVASCARV
jgi:coatomer subunit beta